LPDFCDYSQIELRVLAHMSEDPGLIQAFQDDLDIHTATAAEIFGVDLKSVTADHRRAAKAVNFGSPMDKAHSGWLRGSEFRALRRPRSSTGTSNGILA